MKRFFSAALIAMIIFSALALTACGGGSSKDLSDSKYVGTWKATAMEIGDTSEAPEFDMILTLNDDGTGTLFGGEEGETNTFNWELTSDGFKTSGDVKLKFKDDGDRIKSKIIGVNLIFEKQS